MNKLLAEPPVKIAPQGLCGLTVVPFKRFLTIGCRHLKTIGHNLLTHRNINFGKYRSAETSVSGEGGGVDATHPLYKIFFDPRIDMERCIEQNHWRGFMTCGAADAPET